jgi:hypothetical protein
LFFKTRVITFVACLTTGVVCTLHKSGVEKALQLGIERLKMVSHEMPNSSRGCALLDLRMAR